jgi:hypothetical protein
VITLDDLLHPKRVKAFTILIAFKGTLLLALGILNGAFALRSKLITYECKRDVSAALKENGAKNYKYLALNFCIGGNTSIDTKTLLE